MKWPKCTPSSQLCWDKNRIGFASTLQAAAEKRRKGAGQGHTNKNKTNTSKANRGRGRIRAINEDVKNYREELGAGLHRSGGGWTTKFQFPVATWMAVAVYGKQRAQQLRLRG